MSLRAHFAKQSPTLLGIASGSALAMTSIYIFQPLTKNLHGLESHGSGVLFKPTRGPFVTREFGTWTPASIHKPEFDSVRSTVFSLLVIPIA
jgi:hypothetical protein